MHLIVHVRSNPYNTTLQDPLYYVEDPIEALTIARKFRLPEHLEEAKLITEVSIFELQMGDTGGIITNQEHMRKGRVFTAVNTKPSRSDRWSEQWSPTFEKLIPLPMQVAPLSRSVDHDDEG